MTSLPAVLTAPDVEVVDLRAPVDASTFERRREAVEGAENRAVGAAIRDGADRLLLTRDADGGAWRLPGSPVGSVSDFTGRLEATVAARLGLELADVQPRWVYRQAAVHDDRSAPLYYVVCTARPVRNGTGVSMLVDEDLEADWFAAPPEDLVNPTVVRDRFDG